MQLQHQHCILAVTACHCEIVISACMRMREVHSERERVYYPHLATTIS